GQRVGELEPGALHADEDPAGVVPGEELEGGQDLLRVLAALGRDGAGGVVELGTAGAEVDVGGDRQTEGRARLECARVGPDVLLEEQGEDVLRRLVRQVDRARLRGDRHRAGDEGDDGAGGEPALPGAAGHGDLLGSCCLSRRYARPPTGARSAAWRSREHRLTPRAAPSARRGPDSARRREPALSPPELSPPARTGPQRRAPATPAASPGAARADRRRTPPRRERRRSTSRREAGPTTTAGRPPTATAPARRTPPPARSHRRRTRRPAGPPPSGPALRRARRRR